jgi:alpha-aminoadipic semialdehyde synthase
VDASSHFSNSLLPYVTRALEDADGKAARNDEIDATLKRARIVDNGVLQAKHDWLDKNVRNWRTSHKFNPDGLPLPKKILLLGSGLVAGPAVDVFVKRPDVRLVIASNNTSEANGLAAGRDNITTAALDVSDDKALGDAVAAADVVVSLLPAPMHVQVAKHCIKHGRHLVTASYVSPEMKALHKDAQAADVLLLGECGLDPGIDSMAAMRILERVQKENKRVTSFVSWCGGLPEPAASNVPLAYKFSWSPKAVLTAALNDAHYKLDGKTHTVAGKDLLSAHFPRTALWRGLALEGLANRDSIPYAEKYGLGPVEGLRDLFRGTLRYQGFSAVLDAFRGLGLLSTTPLAAAPASWPDLLAATLSQQGEAVAPSDVEKVVRARLADTSDAIEALEFLSLLPTDAAVPPVPEVPSLTTPIDLFATLLSRKLAYAPGERDSVLLHHAFKLVPKDAPEGAPEQTVTASLLCTGDEKASAMSVTVGCTLAFAALRVADGQVAGRGVHGPYEKDVWEGVLNELEAVGVEVKETWS